MKTDNLESIARKLVALGKGILAADESSGTIEKRLKSINVPSTEENRRAYREILFTTNGAGEFISGVILFDETIRQKTRDGRSSSKCWKSRGSFPGSKWTKAPRRWRIFRAKKLPKASMDCASGSPSIASSARGLLNGARSSRLARNSHGHMHRRERGSLGALCGALSGR